MSRSSFKEFLINEGNSRGKLARDSKSIQYLEDLDIDDFIDSIKDLSKFIVSEKLDGAALRFGFDDDGKFFTTRNGKGNATNAVYKTSDYGVNAAANGFKGAHAALKKNEEILKQFVMPGEAVDIEVLFGRQPNSVVYGVGGFNYIAFLKMAKGTNLKLKLDQSKIEKLSNALKKRTVNVKTINVDTSDGIELVQTPTTTSWKFVSASFIGGQELETVDISKELKKLEEYLSEKNKKVVMLGYDLTNYQVMSVRLTTIPKDLRDGFSEARDEVNKTVIDEFKLPIKEKLLKDFVRKIKPTLQDTQIDDSEDVGIEGLVFLNPENQMQFKVIDKDVFTTLNLFNYDVRNSIRGTVRTDSEEATLEAHGGLFGEAKLRISKLFGISGLGRANEIKKTIRKFKGSTKEETLKNFADAAKTSNENALRNKIEAILKDAIVNMDEELEIFKQDNESYGVKLPTGKKVGYTKEIVRRTLMVFAETRKEINDLIKDVNKCKTLEDILLVLFGTQIQSIHEEEN